MSMGGGDAPPPPDWEGMQRDAIQAGREQTLANRPNQYGPMSSTTWQRGPDGQWTQNMQLASPLQLGLGASMTAASKQAGTPLDLSSLGELGSGDAAMRQGTDAAYSEATRRLGDRFSQGREGLETKLLNQGLQPGTAAYDRAMKSFGEQENDAYAQATDRSVLTGSQIGNTVFGNNLQQRQQMLSEILRKRSQPMQDLQGFASLVPGNGFNQDNSTLAAQGMANNLAVQGGQDAYQRWEDQQGGFMDFLGGALGLAGSVLPFALSDERLKTHIRRLEQEAFPGVPFAVFRYKEGKGKPGFHLGVIAQDLQKVLPEYVRERPDGYLEVNYEFLDRSPGDANGGE